MNGFLFVALGGAFGAAARHGVGLLALRHLPPGWPHGTFAVNVFGSLAMGLVVGWLVSRDGATMSEMRLFLATGVLGGFTTFSAFSLELADMLRVGDTAKAASYAGLSMGFGVAALFAGLWIAKRTLA